MEEIKAPKKERKFLKAVGNIAKVLANELVMGIGRKFIGKAIDKVGKKRQGLVIAFALVAGISYASIDSIPYPITGNKQRLGFQSTGNGLVWRGTAADTVTKPTSYADKNIKAYLILDSVSGSLYVFKQGAWAISEGSTIDTVSLSNRINLKVNISDTAAMLLPYFKDSDTSLLNLISRFGLKLNISDTASMLLPYATKAYADTTGRLYAREDFLNVSTSTLTWTQTDTLIPGEVTVVQVYRNGQILLPSQYTIPTSTSVVIAATSFKVGDNYTVIFPRGGGGGGGSGSGSLTSISGGTGITVSPNPITTTGTVSADLTVLMELTDTSLLNLSTRFASKLNTTDTASLSARIDTKGSGTVTSVASGYGITGGTITTTGTLRLDSASVYNYIRDSIVDVQIGNDTIKILKQEYNNATSDTLVWTTTVKFPIQLRAYILLFRNGQLLINDQFTVIDTNKIKIAATSYKLGENYTLVTVSGIGSAGVSETGNPVYPEAGIALSTGTTWTTSITNNSSNWNTAYSDRLKWDGGNTGLVAATGRTSLGGTTIGQSMFTLTNPSAITFPRFNSDNTITARSAANFRSDIGAGSVTTVTVAAGTPLSIQNTTTTPEISMAAASGSVNGYLSSTDWTTFNNKQNALSNASASVSGILTSTDWSTFNGKQNALTNPVTGTGISSFLPRFTGTSTLDSTRIFYSSGRLGINMDASEATSHLTSRFVIRDFGHNFKFDGSAAGSGYTTTFSHDDTGLKIGQSSNIRDIRFTLNGTSGLTISNNSNSPARAVGIGNDSPSHQLDVTGTFRATGATTLGSTLAVTGAITEGGNNVLTNLDTASLSSRIDLKLNKTDTASLSTRIDGKVSLTATESISGTKTFNNLVNITNQMSISGSVSGGNQLLGKNSSNNGVADITLGTGLSITSNVLNAAIPTERYYFDLGTVAGQADNVTGTYNFSYSGNAFIVPSSLNGYCIDTVNIRAISCTDCPPAAGEKDYYMGVYKVSAGNRVTSTGATMQGSQIVCNEYDLKQENVNHVLTTGDVWWVYLNGSYFSDMEIIKASFIVKKTCN
jgi:hypothetical protein